MTNLPENVLKGTLTITITEQRPLVDRGSRTTYLRLTRMYAVHIHVHQARIHHYTILQCQLNQLDNQIATNWLLIL